MPLPDLREPPPERTSAHLQRHEIRGVDEEAPPQRQIPAAARSRYREPLQQDHAPLAAEPLGELGIALEIEIHVPSARAVERVAAHGEIGPPEMRARGIPPIPAIQARKHAAREEPSLP